MIKNYLKVAFRNLTRDKSFSILNMVGLSVGLASVIMIVAYVGYELSYDSAFSNHASVYRLELEMQNGIPAELNVRTPAQLAATLKKDFPVIKEQVTADAGFDYQFKINGEMVSLKGMEAGPDYFKVFDFPLKQGNPKNVLSEPGSLVISEGIAKRFFPEQNPIGKTLTDNRGHLMHITGVMENIPLNTHFKAEVITSLAGKDYANAPLNWEETALMQQYVLLGKNADHIKLENNFKSVYKKYNFPQKTILHLRAVTDIHLRSHALDEESQNSDIKYIYIFMSAAFLILFIACINYVNLTTARSLQRAKEIGIRKVIGASKSQLIVQFLSESFLLFLACSIIAIFLSWVLWPVFSAKITAYHQVLPLFNASSLLLVLAIVLVGGLLAGAYPAFFLSSLQPVKILKGLSKFGVNITMRKALVIFQFVISGVLIVSTIIIYQQLDYINNARLGFNKDHLINIPYYIRHSREDIFKNELYKNAGITSATVARWRIGERYDAFGTANDLADTTKQITFPFIDTDPDFIKTMEIPLIAGRNFSIGYPNDVINLESLFEKHLSGEQFQNALALKSIILTQEAVKMLHLKNPVGTVLRTGAVRGTVIGVVRDFYGLSLHEKLSPIVLRCDSNASNGLLLVRLSPLKTQQAINDIQSTWKKFYPNERFDFSFTDDKLQQIYSDDKRLGEIFGVFACLAIVICCLGLFGLISLTIQNREKEIGIRKVLGASVLNIAKLVSNDFIKLVFISFLVSSPLAWYIMDKWLQSFTYRINIQWWVFLIACLVALLISIVTLSFQAVKAAIANPVKSLRSE